VTNLVLCSVLSHGGCVVHQDHLYGVVCCDLSYLRTVAVAILEIFPTMDEKA